MRPKAKPIRFASSHCYLSPVVDAVQGAVADSDSPPAETGSDTSESVGVDVQGTVAGSGLPPAETGSNSPPAETGGNTSESVDDDVHGAVAAGDSPPAETGGNASESMDDDVQGAVAGSGLPPAETGGNTSESVGDDVHGAVAAGDSPLAETGGNTSESVDDDVQGAVAGSNSPPAETKRSFDDEEDDGAKMMDGKTGARRGFDNDHVYYKIWEASKSTSRNDDDNDADMRPVADNASSGKRRKGVARSATRTIDNSTEANVDPPAPIDSPSLATASRKSSNAKSSVTRQMSDNAALAAVAAKVFSVKPLSCWHCGKQYERKVYFDRHVLSHTSEGSACSLCGRRYFRLRELARHLQSHKKPKPHVCLLCQKGFSRKQHLQVHHLRRHTNIRPFVCTLCGRDFSMSEDLKAHERWHAAWEQKQQLAAFSSTVEH